MEIYLIAYLIGAIPFGLILMKIFTKQDIRDIGSGNIGATNVLRTGSKLLAFSTLIFDILKGSFLIFFMIGTQTFHLPDFSDPDPLLSPDLIYFLGLVIGFFAILGHCFPVWLKFKGGKGVATTLGVLLAAVPYVGLAACVLWLVTAFVSRTSSLSALLAIAAAPLITLFIYGQAPAIACAIIAILVWIRHKDNIKRIIKGTEPKIGGGKDVISTE